MPRSFSITMPETTPDESGRQPRVSRWSISPEDRSAIDASLGTPSRPSLTDEAAKANPSRVLLRWTDDLDEERAVSLWIGLAAAEGPTAQEAALVRWIDWAGVEVPASIPLRDLARAADELLGELAAIARDPERVGGYDEYDRRSLTRALRAWIRAKETDADAVLGGVRAVLRSEALGGLPASRESERVVLANVLRRNLQRVPSAEDAPLFEGLARVDPSAPVFPSYAESILGFLLLDAEMHRGFPREIASLAPLPAFSNTLRLGLAGIGQGALRAVRLLEALAAHPDLARGLPAPVSREICEHLERALSHSRNAVWSRAARALGRLCGALDGADTLCLRLLEPAAPLTVRRRTHAALGTLRAHAPEALHQRRAALFAQELEAWFVAALAVGLPEHALDGDAHWIETARTYIARGGAESWGTLVLAMREIATRRPDLAGQARALAADVRARAEAYTPRGENEAELVERALVLATRVMADPDQAESTPWVLTHALAEVVARAPSDPSIGAAVEELMAHTDATVSGALRALSMEQSRASARAGVLLEEVVDLVVDGDLEVAGERIARGQHREAVVGYSDALRKRLLKTVWSGLRRPTPSTAPWRRWLLRTASVLPRLEPAGIQGQDRERAVREQILDTLARLADDPSLQQPALQRHVLSVLVELSEALDPEHGGDACVAVLLWIALRSGSLPVHARTRRMLDAEPAERVDRLFGLVEQLGLAGRGSDREIASLAELAGDRGRLREILVRVASELASVSSRRPEAHWSGLPKLDLGPLAAAADDLARAREEPHFGLTREPPRAAGAATESLGERAARLNHTLTSASLKFVDAARRAEITEHYVSELTSLCEAIANACGPIAGTAVRAQLARALVAVRAQAGEASRDRGEDVRYIARLRVLGSLASAAEGGMTNTYLAEGPAPGKRVVVKLLPWERFPGASAEVARSLFEGEMQRLAPIVHPNVVSIIDAGFVDEGAYIALEHIPGSSLESLLRTLGKVDLPTLGPIVRDAARGLAYLHTRGIVHRDIKPGNILVQLDTTDRDASTPERWVRSGFIRAVVIDLGIATDARGTSAENESGIIGTPGFLAPEIARGLSTITPAIDVYALAVVVFEALTGTNPFLEGDPELPTVLVRHGTMLLPLEQLPEDAQNPALMHLLAEAGKLDPRARPTMVEFAERWTAAVTPR